MNFLNIFEDHVAGIFGATRAPFSFKKLAKQAARDMEDQTLVINGVNTAPALYTILIAADDDPMLAPFYPELSREVREFVKAQAEKRRYVFVGEPLVRFMIDPQLRAGKVLGLCRERRRPHARSSVRGRACLPEWPGPEQLCRKPRRPALPAPASSNSQLRSNSTPPPMPQQPTPRAAAPDPLAVADPFAPNAPTRRRAHPRAADRLS